MASLLNLPTLPGELMGCSCNVRAALPQIRVEMLIGSQAEFEITKQITILFFYQLMLINFFSLLKI